jgi:hypothetical protein
VTARLTLLAAAAALLAPAAARAAEVSTVLAPERRQIETADYRLSGQLARVEASGARTSYPITIEARWFPGVLRVLIQVSPRGGAGSAEHAAVRVLLEMRASGASAIWIAHPGDKSASPLTFDDWSQGPLGPGFAWEDFLEQTYFWPHQTLLPDARYGARDCNVVESAPGTANRTHYATVKSWLDRSIGFPVYTEKTLKGSGAMKHFVYYGLRHNGGVWSASQVEEQTTGQSEKTLLIIDRGSANANLSLKDFSLGQLAVF